MAECSSWQPPRPCEAYRAEWKLCRSARHFLHHYYVHGERPACEQWRRDLASCRDWEERRSDEAQVLGPSCRSRDPRADVPTRPDGPRHLATTTRGLDTRDYSDAHQLRSEAAAVCFLANLGT
ncbi:synaptic plasticity regulator PANTS isoform X2 [Saimiri boliviensis]|uniref:synaptic plasticity regulator PANTS isoform X2 n=1 Tax=Saimiri boliviensis TaxID=27679 RepID=UPI003D780DA7